MSPEEIYQNIQEVFTELFEADFKISPDMKREDFDEWDSLRHIHIVARLEQQFGIRFNGAAASKMIDYQSIV